MPAATTDPTLPGSDALASGPLAARPARRTDWPRRLPLVLGAALVGMFLFVALAAPWLAPPDPDVEFSTYRGIGQINRWVPFEPAPGLVLGSVPDPTHQRQLDIWYSLVWGTRTALRFGLLVVLVAGTFGVILGGSAAYLGGLPNTLLMGFTDAFLAMPLIAAVIFFQQLTLAFLRSWGAVIFFNGEFDLPLPPTPWQTFLIDLDPLLVAVIAFSWMPYARLTNAVVLRIRRDQYILASRSLGAGHLRLIFRHLLPNAFSPALVLAARDVGYMVLLQAGFTFIGLSHRSEWGELLSLGRKYVIGPGGSPLTYWWIFFPATLAIVLFGIGWSLLGDGLNDRLNPSHS